MLNKEKVSLGIAPIGWTNDDMPDLGKENTFEQTVSEMALAGFTGSEVGSHYPTDPEVLKKALDLRKMTICNQWFSSFLISRPYEETEAAFIEQCDFLKKVGAKCIGVSEQSYSIQGKLDHPIQEGKYVMNDEEWDKLVTGLNKLGKIAKDKGMVLTFHYHMGTVIQTEEEIDRFMESVDPDLVYLLFDSGMGEGQVFDWSVLGGIDREFFLAGGLQAENLTEAMEAVRPYAVDLSSGIESNRKKDPEKMRRIMELVERYRPQL